MKKILSFTIATAMLLSVVSCGKTEPEQYSVTASDGLDTYVRLFEERVEEKPDSFTILSGDDASAYGADVDHFVDDEGYTIRADDGEVVILSKTAAGADRAVRHFTVYGNYDNYSYTYGEDYKVRGLTVMGKPIEGFAVVCPDDSDAAMCYATEELVRYVSAATGTVLPVYTAADYAAAEDAPVNAITFSVDYDTHGDEAFTIDVKADGNIDIICGRYRGGIYGVYGLLRDMGWRFIYDGTEYLYESDGLDITEDCDRTEEAGIANRFASVTISDNKHGLHFGGNYDSEAVAKYGQYGIVQKACHGLQSEKINWKDSYEGFNGYSQPCYSDEKVIQAIEDHYRAYLDHRYATNAIAGRDLNYLDVSQYDTGPSGFCKCYDCHEVVEEDGSVSGTVLRMTNRIADMAATYDPDIVVLMLAYAGTNKPTKVTVPRDNVRIAYCFYIGADTGYICSNHNINDENCKRNVGYIEEFEGWKKVCGADKLQVWYYSFNCDEIACQIPCFDTAYGDVKYLIDSDIDCIMFCEGENNDRILMSALADLVWYKDMTEEEYWNRVEEYFDLFYGGGGKYVYECIQILIRSADKKGCFTNFSDRLAGKLDYTYLAANFDYILGLFDEALMYAETEEIADRIEITKARIMYPCINATHESEYVNGTAEQRAVFEERYTELHNLFQNHSILVFDNYSRKLYAPDEIDFTKTPTEDWCIY